MLTLTHVADRLRADIVVKARELNVEPALLQSIIKTEARSSGFQWGIFRGARYKEPIILYECHVAYRVIKAKSGRAEANRLARLHPDIINPYPYYSKHNPYKYGRYSQQHKKLQKCVAVAGYDVAMQAASWGVGQVLGENWKMCGYQSVRGLINDAYGSEKTQLDLMCNYLKGKRGMIEAMQAFDYHKIALLYNGKDYAVNNYHTKIEDAHVAYRKKYGN